MKVLILGSTSSRNAGGIFNSMRMLGHNLHAFNEAEIQFLLHDDEYSSEDKKFYEPLVLHNYIVKGPKLIGFSINIYKHLTRIKPDIIHTQGIWMYFSHVNRKYHLKTKTPYVITPHGMLDPWQLKQSFTKDLKKKLALFLYEKKHLQQASCIQALCKSEYDSIRAFGLRSPVAIIPNGIEIPLNTTRSAVFNPPYRWDQNVKRKTLLFLSRIHHKKGLDNLLYAWALTCPTRHDWQLIIAGETKNTVYMQSLIDITDKLKITGTVKFIGGQFGADKETCFIDADAFILPSFSEGLPMAVLEAWSYKLPVIMTSFCNIPEGFDKEAAIHIDPEPENIASGIEKLISLSEQERNKMGQNGYSLVKDKFTWDQVAASTIRLYRWLLGEKEKPNFVVSD